jgi:UDP-2,3-diacylglucosamine pyrophosphatase LpxH
VDTAAAIQGRSEVEYTQLIALEEPGTAPGAGQDAGAEEGLALQPPPAPTAVGVLDALILSDLHLGAVSCQVRAVESFLEDMPFSPRRLVLNGDVLESTEYRLTKHHWRVLSRLRKLSDEMELIWVQGNHDSDAESIAHLIGAAFVPEYEFSSGGRRVLVIHGDRWDRFLTDHPVLTIFADWFYLRLQGLSRRMAARAKRRSKTFLRVSTKVRDEAVAYGRKKGADVVICGHTHNAEAPGAGAAPAAGLPRYFNSGCWTDHHCHYLTVADGLTRLHELQAP